MKILYRPAPPDCCTPNWRRKAGYVPQPMREGKVMSRQVRRQLLRRRLKWEAPRRG